MASNQPPVRDITLEETRDLARRNALLEVQQAIDFCMELRANNTTSPEVKNQAGTAINRLIDSKKWINFLATGKVYEKEPKETQ